MELTVAAEAVMEGQPFIKVLIGQAVPFPADLDDDDVSATAKFIATELRRLVDEMKVRLDAQVEAMLERTEAAGG